MCFGGGALYFRDMVKVYKIPTSTNIISYGANPNNYNIISSIACDNSGALYVCGLTPNTQGFGYAVFKEGSSSWQLGGWAGSTTNAIASNGYYSPNQVNLWFVNSMNFDNCGNLYFSQVSSTCRVNVNQLGNISHPFLTSNINNVDISFTGSKTETIGSQAGKYYWSPPPSGTSNNYTITPSKNNDIAKANGIAGADVIAVQRHFLALGNLDNSYKYIAADVNNDGVINGTDILRMKRMILALDNTFVGANNSGNRLWAFVDKSTLPTTSTTNPFINIGNTNPIKYNSSSISLNNVTSCNPTGKDFYGVKLGDVDWNWNPAIARSAPIQFYFNDIDATELENVRVPIRVNNFTNMLEMQFSLSFDPAHFDFVSFTNDNLEFDINDTRVSGDYHDGVMSFIWLSSDAQPVTLNDGSVLFNLILHKKKSVKVDDIVLTSDLTKVEAIDGNMELVPLTKKKCKIVDNSAGATANTHETWDILPSYTNMGNLMIKTFTNDPKNVTIQVYDKSEQLIFESVRSLSGGDGFIYANLRSKMHLEQGVYYVKLVGMDDEDSKAFFVGNLDEYATKEDIANGDISGVVSDNPTLALYSLRAQLYQQLIADPTIAVNSTLLQDFVTTYTSSNFAKIQAIETALTDGNIGDAASLVSNFTTSNAVDVNYKNYYSWVLKLINQEGFTLANENSLNALVIQCPLTAGMIVFSSRDLSNSLTEDNTMFGDVCPNNLASRSSNNYVYKPTIVVPKPIDRSKQTTSANTLISVYPNPTKGLVHLIIPTSEKGNWVVTVTNLLGKKILQQSTNCSTRNVDINIQSGAGVYFLTLTNTATKKQTVQKIVVL